MSSRSSSLKFAADVVDLLRMNSEADLQEIGKFCLNYRLGHAMKFPPTEASTLQRLICGNDTTES